MLLLIVVIGVLSFGTPCYGDNSEERQIFGSNDLLGLLTNSPEQIALPSDALTSTALLPNFPQRYPPITGLIQHYPYPQQLQYVPEAPHMFPDRPLPASLQGGQFLGQIGQYLQQGLVGQHPGNLPTGGYGQILGQLAGGFGTGGQYIPPGQYQTAAPPGGTSLTEALTSIAKYDDLKCVPRLLCEMAAGGKPGQAGAKQQSSLLPFINSETIFSLLTLLNFGNSSPLFVFGRAILLGMTAKGDSYTCLSAYPTCPKDPDRLVDYLNNHNGGLFRFFGTNRPYYPTYHQGRIQTSRFTTTGRPQTVLGTHTNRGPKSIQFPKTDPSSTSHRPPSQNGFDVYNKPSFYKRESSTVKPSLIFPTEENNRYSALSNPNVASNSAGKQVSFPSLGDFHIERPPLGKKKPTSPMFFPDKTGTGDLRLDLDDFNVPVIITSSSPVFRNEDRPIVSFTSDRKQILKFPQNNENRGKRDGNNSMKFPTTSYTDSVNYDRQQRSEKNVLKFPISRSRYHL